MEWILEVATTGTGAEEPYDFTRLAWLGDAVAPLRGPCGPMPSLVFGTCRAVLACQCLKLMYTSSTAQGGGGSFKDRKL